MGTSLGWRKVLTIGFMYQFGVKGMRAMRSISLWGRWKQACINGHQFGVEENPDYIGFVYQFGLKEMRAPKHVQYQFRVGDRHV